MIECQKHQDYQESINWLIGYVEEYTAHGKSIVAGHADGVNAGAKDVCVFISLTWTLINPSIVTAGLDQHHSTTSHDS